MHAVAADPSTWGVLPQEHNFCIGSQSIPIRGLALLVLKVVSLLSAFKDPNSTVHSTDRNLLWEPKLPHRGPESLIDGVTPVFVSNQQPAA